MGVSKGREQAVQVLHEVRKIKVDPCLLLQWFYQIVYFWGAFVFTGASNCTLWSQLGKEAGCGSNLKMGDKG